MARALFDPLRYIEEELRIQVELDANGSPKLGPGHPINREKAQRVLATYSDLVALQVRKGRRSIQWLMAHGKIHLEGGRYKKGQK
jgi:hypothetical protein